jgi:hypothetical protein
MVRNSRNSREFRIAIVQTAIKILTRISLAKIATNVVKGVKNFDHNKTNFKLEEKHLGVNCKLCHKTKFTDPLKYARCTDCHVDYHNRQFAKDDVSPDCSQCHTVKGFTLFSYTMEQHNLGKFPLQGAHAAIPCFACHKKQEKWSFRKIGINCNDCHTDIHQSFIQAVGPMLRLIIQKQILPSPGRMAGKPAEPAISKKSKMELLSKNSPVCLKIVRIVTLIITSGNLKKMV